MTKTSVSVIGVGRLGGALALALAAHDDYAVENLIVRRHNNSGSIGEERVTQIAAKIAGSPNVKTFEEIEKIASDVILIATPDAEIRRAADALLPLLLAGGAKPTPPFVFHTSGAVSSEVLRSLQEIGCPTGSLHPLVSISDPVAGATRFAEVYFAVEGAPAAAVFAAEKIVAALDGKSFIIETRYKTLYHAAAVTACGHFVALVDAAIEMLTKCGLAPDEAQRVLLPLIKSTAENLAAQTPAEALTGTFARADDETFARHLETLDENVSPEIREIYLQLGLRSVHLAERENANREKSARLEKIRAGILLAKKKLK